MLTFQPQAIVVLGGGDRPAGFESTKLSIEPVVSMKANIPNKIATALDPLLQAMRVELRKGEKDVLKIIKDTGKSHWVVRFSDVGDDAIAVVSRTKARIEKLLAGTVVTDHGITLWHPWFAVANDAGAYLNWLSFQTNILQDRRRACSMLKAKVQDLHSENAFTIRTTEVMSIAEALVMLKPVFGTNVRLGATGGSTNIKHAFCSIRALTPRTNCVICWDRPSSFDETIFLPRGHIYCHGCFDLQFNHLERVSLPLVCAGVCSDNTDCQYLFDIKLLREELSTNKFDALLNSCLDIYIRSHRDEFSYCPTIDCPTIYRPIPDAQRAPHHGASVTCPTCLLRICTSCRAIHTGLTCREYIDATDGQDALNEYKSQAANRTKDSPFCHVLVEKLPEGCNHMRCLACGTHFCWLCLQISPDMGGAYAHLHAVHGGYGLEGVPLDQVPDPDAVGGANQELNLDRRLL
ncbi:hypothetical protein BKA64DRAFT_708826 [Cadophora sp. MPI-SDFR-AT-0126]|nr:hypothetical protein BKA64DRAFT_708826 [Leotiomycetes sp. MPI-SDFR-AT-0126]